MLLRDLSPDLIVHRARVYTLDAHNTVAQAIAIKDGRIVALGNDDEILRIAGYHTERIDALGKPIIPGIFDSHNHMLQVGVKLARIRLDECTSPAEMMELVRAKAKETPAGTWLIGEGWSEHNFSDGRLPTRHDLDPATAQHPVILMRFFNMDVVNSVALRMAGITRATPDPIGGKIDRDASGEPTGILRASAKQLVRNLLPQPMLDELKHALKLGCDEMNRYGITSIVEPGLMPYEVQAYQAYHIESRLSVRTNMMLSWHGFRDEENAAELDARAKAIGLFTGIGNEWLRVGGLKMAIDGGTSSRSAWMYEPFEGEDKVGDYNRLDPEDLLRYFQTAQELGWDVGIHVCGDRAMDVVVDALAQVGRAGPRRQTRHNIIHAYFPSDRALRQMAEHQIGAVIQPTFIYWEGDMIFRDVGERRAANYKPARKFLQHGIPLMANSDIPSTVSPNPFPGLYSLVTRKNNLGHYIAPDQALTREEALRAYTISGTWLTREEKLKGSIELGKLADLALLDQDYFEVSDEAIKDIKVTMTMVGGKVVWEDSR